MENTIYCDDWLIAIYNLAKVWIVQTNINNLGEMN